MSLLQQSPRFDLAGATRLAHDIYGLDATAAALPSERDQNFLLTTAAGGRFVLKIANASESLAMLEAQNAAMEHASRRVTFCPRVIPATAGVTIAVAPGGHFVRLVTFLPGTPLAEAREGRSRDGGGTQQGRSRDGVGTWGARSANWTRRWPTSITRRSTASSTGTSPGRRA